MLKSLGPFLFGALDPVHAVGDLSMASAGRAIEIIDVESKNTLITVTSSVILPVQSGLEQAGFVCESVSAVLWTCPPSSGLSRCALSSFICSLGTESGSTEGQTHQIFRHPSSTENK